MATADPLIDSLNEVFELTDEQGYKRPFKIAVKRYSSGRTRIILPAGFEVAGMTNNGELKIELMPRRKVVLA